MAQDVDEDRLEPILDNLNLLQDEVIQVHRSRSYFREGMMSESVIFWPWGHEQGELLKKWRDAGGRRAELYGCALWSWGSEMGTTVCEHEHMPPTVLPTWAEMSQSDSFEHVIKERGTSESLLLKTPVKVKVSHSGKSTGKSRSPASKARQMLRLLMFQERLVREQGLPKSRLQMEMDVTPTSPPVFLSPKQVRCCKNLSMEFQGVGVEAQPRRNEGKLRCEGPVRETVTSTIKTNNLLCSEGFQQNLGEQTNLQAGPVFGDFSGTVRRETVSHPNESLNLYLAVIKPKVC